jgi:bifunctional oligoribonuclease and PAP phosphatase NrnA
MTTPSPDPIRLIVDMICAHRRFVVSSHARPDGDSIGSQMAMAFALRALGKDVRVVNKDAPPPTYAALPGVGGIEIADEVSGAFDVAIVMECGSLSRTGVAGLDRGLVVNIDHHPGNSGFGTVAWFDPSASACAELVYDLVGALGVQLSVEIATHVYVAILTDTGGFHYSGITARTFAICQAVLEAGVDPVAVARAVFDSTSLGRLRLIGATLNTMTLASAERIAVLHVDEAVLDSAGATMDDTDGVINLPLTVKIIQASVFIKHIRGDEYRVSLRSKGEVDVGAAAKAFGGGGHKNAAGCTLHGTADEVRARILTEVENALERAAAHRQADGSELA